MQQAQQYAQPPVYASQPQGLGFGDGFRFGCGFFMAGVIAIIIFYVVIGVLFLLLSVLGVGLGGVLQQMLREMSFVVPALLLV